MLHGLHLCCMGLQVRIVQKIPISLIILFPVKGALLVSKVKIIGRGVDTLILNVCYADKQFRPIKQELNADLQEVLSSLQDEARINEAAEVTQWAFKGFALYMQPKGSRGRLNQMIAQVCLSSE
jgi:hypothetical protein